MKVYLMAWLSAIINSESEIIKNLVPRVEVFVRVILCRLSFSAPCCTSTTYYYYTFMPSPSPPPHLQSSSSNIFSALEAFVLGDDTLDSLLNQITSSSEIDQNSLAANLWLLYAKLTKPLPPRFFEVLKALCEQKLTTRTLLQEHLPIEAYDLADGNSEPSDRVRRLEVRWRTRTWYTQQKYNLFREDSQGYARLLALMHEESDPLKLQNAVLQLIGIFSLDPNRVVDVALGELQRRIENTGPRHVRSIVDSLVPLLQICPKRNLGMVLGFKFQKYQLGIIEKLTSRLEETRSLDNRASPGSGNETTQKSVRKPLIHSVTPEALLMVATALIDKEVLDLDVVFPYLYPEKQTDLIAIEEMYHKELREKARSIVTISLMSSKKNNPMQTARAEAVSSGHILQSLVVTRGPFWDPHLQKIGILPAALATGGWKLFKKFVSRLGSPAHGLDTMAHPPIAQITASYISAIIDRAVLHCCGSANDKGSRASKGDRNQNEYESYMQPREPDDRILWQLESTDEIRTREEFLGAKGENVREMLLTLGAHTRFDVDLLFAICRLLRGTAGEHTVEILREVVLPACALSGSNVGLGFALWETLKDLPYAARFAVYENLASEKPKEYPLIAAAVEQTTYDIKQILKRISNDNYKRFGRTIAKLTHGNALPVAHVMVETVQSYPNLILPLVESLKFISPASLDMIIYHLLKNIASSRREKLKQDGHHLAQWYSSCCTFLSALCKKFSTVVDFAPLLHFCYNQLVNEDTLVVNLLSELLSHVGTVNPLPAMTRAQVLMTAAGPKLRGLPQDLGLSYRYDKRGDERALRCARALRAAIQKAGLCEALGVMIAKAKDSIYEGSRPLKVVSGIRDRVQKILIQYSTFWKNGIGGGLEPLLKLGVQKESAFTLERANLNYLAMIDSSAQSSSGDVAMANAGDADEPGEVNDEGMVPDAVQDGNKAIFSKMDKLEGAFWWNSLKEFGFCENSDYATIVSVYKVELARLERAEKVWLDASKTVDAQISQRLEAKTNINRIRTWKAELREELGILQSQGLKTLKSLGRILGEKSTPQEAEASESEELVVLQFLHKCILPRALSSKGDALYCSRFVAALESMSIEQWSLEKYYTYLISVVRGLLFSCSEDEAASLALFYAETFSRLEFWRKDATGSSYSKEVGQRWKSGAPMSFRDWCKWLRSAHENLVSKILNALESSEYLELRNVLVFLNEVGTSFPKITVHASNVEKAILKLMSGPRKDIELMANSYNARLKAKEKGFVDEERFCHSSIVRSKENLDGSEKELLNTPMNKKSDSSGWNLDPNAPEFVPATDKPDAPTTPHRRVRGRGDVRANYTTNRFDSSIHQTNGGATDLGKRIRREGGTDVQQSGPPLKRSRSDADGFEDVKKEHSDEEPRQRTARDDTNPLEKNDGEKVGYLAQAERNADKKGENYETLGFIQEQEPSGRRILEQALGRSEVRGQAVAESITKRKEGHQSSSRVPSRSPDRFQESTDMRGRNEPQEKQQGRGRGHDDGRVRNRSRESGMENLEDRDGENRRRGSDERQRIQTNGTGRGKYAKVHARLGRQGSGRELDRRLQDHPSSDGGTRDTWPVREPSRHDNYEESQYSSRQQKIPTGPSSGTPSGWVRSPRMSPQDQRETLRVDDGPAEEDWPYFDQSRQGGYGNGSRGNGSRGSYGRGQGPRVTNYSRGGGRDLERSKSFSGTYGNHDRQDKGRGYSGPSQAQKHGRNYHDGRGGRRGGRGFRGQGKRQR